MPRKFTEANVAVIVAQLRAGVSFAEACREVGVRQKTAEGWLTRGRQEAAAGDATDYAAFAQAVDDAREEHDRAGMSVDQFDKYLSRAVRKGSVSAMKLWADLYHPANNGAGDDADSEPADPFDELAPRRAGK